MKTEQKIEQKMKKKRRNMKGLNNNETKIEEERKCNYSNNKKNNIESI